MGDNNCPPADCGSSPQTHDVQGSDASSPELACAAPTRRKFKCCRKGERSHTCHKCVICKAHSAPSCIRYDPDAATVVCTICHATFTAKSILTTHQERKHDLHTCPSCNANLHTHRSAGCGATNVATTNSQSCNVARSSMVFGVGGLARQLQPAPGARVVATQTTPTQILQVIFRYIGCDVCVS
jgi:hypothetical protein